jgi:hypothetical protein
MVSGNSQDEARESPPRRQGSGWSRLVSGVAKQFLGEPPQRPIISQEPPNEGPSHMQEFPPSNQPLSAADAVSSLGRTLDHFEQVLSALEQRTRQQQRAAPEEVSQVQRVEQSALQQLEAVLGQLSNEANRLAEGAAQLAQVAARLEERVAGLSESMERTREIEAAPPPPPEEPRFAANGRPVGVVLASVPGFQGLMDVQRALSNMPSTEGASVVGYKNGEASLEIILREPVSARQIVDGLQESTGHHVLIEEARPDDQRLRLRFVD